MNIKAGLGYWVAGSIAAVIIISSFLIFAPYFPDFTGRNNIPDPVRKETPQKEARLEDEFEQTLENINARVSSITLSKSHIIFKDKPNPKFQYKLAINLKAGNSNSTVYLFDKYDYVISTGGDEEYTPTAGICELIDAIYDRKDPILEALREVKAGGKVSFPIKGVGAELEAGNITPILVEILYSIRKFIEIKNTHPEILIRGYADGEQSSWERPLVANRYYENIPVYPPVDPDSESPNVFVKQEEPLPIGSTYKNKDLPDLRAYYVKQVLVDPYLQLCKDKKPVTHVLQGFEFKNLKNKPLERKVQVFILIYEN